MRSGIPNPPWIDVSVVDETGSTNQDLLADPRPWRLLVADHQTAGRGRLDRRWEAPSGTSVAVSMTVPLPADQARWGWVPLLVGGAVRRALRQLTGLEFGLKWPNDVLLRGHDGVWRKVAGVLCAVAYDERPVVVIGVGINVRQSGGDLPSDAATSLRIEGSDVRREDIVVRLAESIRRIESAWERTNLDDLYRAACVTIGQRVEVQLPDTAPLLGDAIAIDQLGRLVVRECETGEDRAVAVGDVVHVRPSVRREVTAGHEDEAPDAASFVDGLEERLLGSRRTLRRGEVADLAHVDPESTRQIWRALGFANARDEDVVFNSSDVESLERVHRLMQRGDLDEDAALGMARALGRSLDRLTMWQLQLVTDYLTGDPARGIDSDVVQRAALKVVDMAPDLEVLLIQVWRRSMAVAISRLVADAEPETHIGVVRTVGFADLVNFTQRVREMSERDLAVLVLRFEELASDIVSQHNGALVKTVGDEVLFSHRSPAAAVDIALDLLEATNADPHLPSMRVGVATGRVLARLGDIYGTVVNRASRLTSSAAPASVLVDSDVARAILGRPDISAIPEGPRDLHGLGEVEAWRLQRVPPYQATDEETHR